MGAWEEVYRNGLEGPFYDQDGIGELTLPWNHHVVWDPDLPRPEMDAKRSPQVEVYEGLQSAVGFLPSAMFKWWVYTDLPIPLEAGARTKASTWVMIVSHGIQGDDSRPGACGMRIGLSLGEVDDPSSAAIAWSEWWVVRGSLVNERVWHQLVTPEVVLPVGSARLWIQCNADVAARISAGHWDLEVIEQYIEESSGVTEARVREIVWEELARARITPE